MSTTTFEERGERLAPGRGPVPTVPEFRHRTEVPLLWLMGLITLAGVLVLVAFLLGGETAPSWAVLAATGLAAPFIAGAVVIRHNYWKTIANGIEVTEQQFPEVHDIYVSLAREMGLEEPLPRLYVTNGNGTLNAFASKCQLQRHFVVVYSDMLDIAYEHGDYDGLRFVLAHELGHVLCGHVDLWRNALRALPKLLFLANTMTRSQEYSADRVASYFAPEGSDSLLVLVAGKRAYRRADLDHYMASVRQHKDGFWLRVVNFLANHAVGFRRLEAIERTRSQGWDVHGRML